MRSRGVALAAAGLAVVLVAGCGADPVPPAGPMVLRAEGVARLAPAADAPVGALVDGIAQFGYDLAPKSATANWIASPASIAFALAMVRAGAVGTTATEIDKTFGFPAGVHPAFNALSRQLVTAELPPRPTGEEPSREPGVPAAPTIVCIGNRLFPATGFEISQPFLRTLAEQYGAGVYPVDFHQATAKQSIDDWANQQTAGRITKVFDDLDPDTALVLANTVYLKGEWRVPFDKAATADADFHRAGGSTVRVPTMQAQLRVPYAVGEGWQAIELAYGEDGTFAMRLVLPTGSTTPHDLLSPKVQAAVAAGFTDQRVNIQLPRWEFGADVALKDELIRLGMPSVFDSTRAELSGMSPVPLYLAQAIHRATISVDEFGTEAAAVTAVAAMPTSAMEPPQLTFNADHPFAFSIVHRPTGTPLFVGQVADPAGD